VTWEVDHLSLIGDRQFGSRHHYSAPDAALCLQYKARETIHHGQIGAVLLFDISRFFDHLDPILTAAMLRDLRVDDATIAWVSSFMTDRSARLSFNNHLLPSFCPSIGTPQGSPLSPILLALTTLPLLQESLDFDSMDLTLYVNDRCIYGFGPTFISAMAKVVQSFETVLHLLRCMGLKVDFDKTEVMFFHPQVMPGHGVCLVTVPISIGVKLPRGLSVRLERFQVMAIVWERRKMLPAELR
jgi:Reverse transcriptase (RNA-dependent DNA polymerase)